MTRRPSLVLCVLLSLAANASAQPSPSQPTPQPQPSPQPSPQPAPQPQVATCVRCARALENLDALPPPHGDVLRSAIPRFQELDQLGISGRSISTQQHRELGAYVPATEQQALRVYVDAFGEQALEDLAGLVCTVDESACVRVTYDALLCAAGVCARELPMPEPRQGCDPYAHTYKGKKVGFGGEVATGWRDSAQPNDHRAWGFGLEARRKVKKRFGLIGRFDWQTGRDAGIDGDGDGRDDDGTGRVSRLSVLAGPTLRFNEQWSGTVPRYLEIDALGGYTVMSSPTDENGPIAGIDLAFQLAVTRWGLRAWQGFGDASDARAVLFHAGFAGARESDKTVVGGCDFVRNKETRSRFALGFDLALSGYELASGIGYMPPMPGFEVAYFVTSHFQAIGRGDLTVFTNGDADHVLHHSVFAGARIDMTPAETKPDRTGPFITLLAGYGWGAVTKPSSAGSGPVFDGSLGYMMQGDEGAGWVRLHGRLGVVPANEDLRALFLSVGLELRLDPKTWRPKTGE